NHPSFSKLANCTSSISCQGTQPSWFGCHLLKRIVEMYWDCARITGYSECDLKAAENDCLERRNSIRPRVSSRVAYKAERGGNELFWSPWKMYPRSRERHRNREATVYLPA